MAELRRMEEMEKLKSRKLEEDLKRLLKKVPGTFSYPESAAAGGVDVMRISFVGAVRNIIAFAPALALRPVWKLPMIYEAMLMEIASHLVPERPGRLEPRKTTHNKKKYPGLKTTRQQWRKQYAA